VKSFIAGFRRADSGWKSHAAVWQCLYFLPEPQGPGAFRGVAAQGGADRPEADRSRGHVPRVRPACGTPRGSEGSAGGARLDLLLRFGQRLIDAGVEDTGQRAYRWGVPGSPMDAGSTARIVRGTRLSWRHLSSRLPLLSEADDLIPDKGQLR